MTGAVDTIWVDPPPLPLTIAIGIGDVVAATFPRHDMAIPVLTSLTRRHGARVGVIPLRARTAGTAILCYYFALFFTNTAKTKIAEEIATHHVHCALFEGQTAEDVKKRCLRTKFPTL